MSKIDSFFAVPQYSFSEQEKKKLLAEELFFLTKMHREQCIPYRHILDASFFPQWEKEIDDVSKIPFLPVRLFKTLDLRSVPLENVIKTLTSSGTTSQVVSRVAVDKETSMLQTKALVSIISSYIGSKRLPMIIIDTQSIIRDREAMSARGAGLVGLSNFGREHFYALNENLQLDVEGLLAYSKKWNTQPILIFGFTFMVWQYFVQRLLEEKVTIDLSKAFLIHSGGWKKMEEQAVNYTVFKKALRDVCGISSVYNFYGMVEQVGSIYMECEEGYFHAPNFAEIIIRNYHDWSEMKLGEQGIVQTLSVLPRSYPGHSLLTEDLGTIHGIDSCRCGRKGTYFTIEGRIPQAELRGCSDTHAEAVLGEYQQ